MNARVIAGLHTPWSSLTRIVNQCRPAGSDEMSSEAGEALMAWRAAKLKSNQASRSVTPPWAAATMLLQMASADKQYLRIFIALII